MPHKPTLTINTDGGRGRSARIIPSDRRWRRRRQEVLTPAIKTALDMLLSDGRLTRAGHFWYGQGRNRIGYPTIEAMYGRALCKIVTEAKNRRKQVAELTEIGLRIARDLKREREELSPALAPDDFDARDMLVYGDEG